MPAAVSSEVAKRALMKEGRRACEVGRGSDHWEGEESPSGGRANSDASEAAAADRDNDDPETRTEGRTARIVARGLTHRSSRAAAAAKEEKNRTD